MENLNTNLFDTGIYLDNGEKRKISFTEIYQEWGSLYNSLSSPVPSIIDIIVSHGINYFYNQRRTSKIIVSAYINETNYIMLIPIQYLMDIINAETKEDKLLCYKTLESYIIKYKNTADIFKNFNAITGINKKTVILKTTEVQPIQITFDENKMLSLLFPINDKLLPIEIDEGEYTILSTEQAFEDRELFDSIYNLKQEIYDPNKFIIYITEMIYLEIKNTYPEIVIEVADAEKNNLKIIEL